MLASSAQLRLGIDTANRDQYLFHPKLSAAGDFIPTVEWVFSQLDLKYGFRPRFGKNLHVFS
jgi:hypothetical protein